MTVSNLLKEAKKLSADQREELAQQILASVIGDDDANPLDDNLRTELDRRWADHLRNPEEGYSREEVRKKLAKLKKTKRV